MRNVNKARRRIGSIELNREVFFLKGVVREGLAPKV